MPRRSASPLLQSQDDLDFVRAARRFNATGGIWPSTVLPPRSTALAKEVDKVNGLFQIHERSCRVLAWHLNGAMRRHSNPLKVVTSFVAGVCNPKHAELGALGSIWSLPESRRRHVQGAFEELANRLASVLEAGRSAGTIRSCECLIASQLILGLVLLTPVAVSQAPPRKLLNGRRLVEGLRDLIIHGRSGGSREAHRLPPPAHDSIPWIGNEGDPLRCLGITDGRGVAAAFMLGAEGAWVGTAFLATDEAGLLPFQKEALVEGGDGDTMVSKSVTGKPARVIRNKWAQAWVDAGRDPLPMPLQSMVAGPVMSAASRAERKDIVPGFAGQGMGLIKAIRPARDVLADLVSGAEAALARAQTSS
jgi:hypothetical protein